MENDQHAYHLKKLIEELTTSGKEKLNEETFKKVKKICKSSDIYVIELYRLLSKQLRKKHAEIRYSAFQICDEIFRRSHCFRELLLKDFNIFVDLVLGLNPHKPLPKPEAVARKLKQKCVEAIQYWYDNFNVRDFFIALDEEDTHQEGGFMHEETINQEGGFFHDDEGDEKGDIEYGSEFMRGHGILKGTNVQINFEDIKKVQETADNAVVIENLKEHVHVLKTKFFPQVKKWEQIMRPYSEGNGSLVKRILDLKQSVEGAVKMFESLKIIPREKPLAAPNYDFDSDDDDDLVEVPFDDPRVVRAAASEAALLGIVSSPCDAGTSHPDDPYNQPSTSGVTWVSTEQSLKETGNDKKKSQSIRCPDEYLISDSFTPKRHHNPLAGLSQVWTATPDLHEQDEVQSTGGILGVATQRVNFELTFEPVKWACRAPLMTGRLCPRKDREKCPLHGPIVPRDEAGKPLKPEDAARERAAREKYERDHPAWQDPQLLAELKAATGVDLKVTKGRKKHKRKYENLTDLKKTTPRDRLAKKVLSRKAVQRVNSALSREYTSAPSGSSCFNFGSS
ncbi:UV-stimulated scaffold protein A-like [Panulirus ornatus]|uniref:UV-stimulated scaffold protein A-like n=1 Tax=Panulirus ornatus TaxID=150431 RepID=UPI003A8BA88F